VLANTIDYGKSDCHACFRKLLAFRPGGDRRTELTRIATAKIIVVEQSGEILPKQWVSPLMFNPFKKKPFEIDDFAKLVIVGDSGPIEPRQSVTIGHNVL
jgi:hypothetical protein